MPYRQTMHVRFGQQEGRCNGCRNEFPFRVFEVDCKGRRENVPRGRADRLVWAVTICTATPNYRNFWRVIMAVSAGISNALERNWGMVDRAIDGLSDETLARRISDSDNSIGWLLFHMSRVVDVFMNARFQGKPQIWIEGGWCEKFGLSDDPETTGQGWDAARVAAWPLPSRDVLVGYYEAMKACCREYMSSVTDEELSAAMSLRPGADPEPKETIMGVLVFDNIVHGGQIAFLRGHLEGMGWFV